MPRRNLTPPPSPLPQTPPVPAVQAVQAPGMPSHLQRPKALEMEQFPQTQAFRSGLQLMDDRNAAVTDLFNRARAGDPQSLQLLQQREAESNFGAYGNGPAAPAPAAVAPVEDPSIANGGYGRDIIDTVNSSLGSGVHNVVQAGVHGLGYLARQGEGLTNAVLGTESGMTGDLVNAYDAWDAEMRLADGSTYTPKTLGTQIAAPFVQAIPGVMAGGPVVNSVKALANAPWLAQGMMRGGFADATAFDPMAPNASNAYNEFVTDNGGETNPVTDALAMQPGDSEGLRRIKMMGEGTIFGTALEGAGRGLGRLFRGGPAPAPTPDLPPPPEAMSRGEFDPVEGGPVPGQVSPFQQDLAPGTFGEGPGQSPFGGQFEFEPRARPVQDMTSTVTADPVVFPQAPGEQMLPDIQRGAFSPTGSRQAMGPDGLPVGERGEFVQTGVRPATEGGLPGVDRGDFVQTGERPAVGPDGLPLGRRGEFVDTGEAAVGPDGLPAIRRDEFVPTGERTFVRPTEGYWTPERTQEDGYHKFDADTQSEGFFQARPKPGTPDGFNKFEAAPREETGFFRAAPRSTPPEPSPYAAANTRIPSDAERAGIDTSSETRVGGGYLEPIDVDTTYPVRPLEAPGSRATRARSEETPGDPYAETFRQSRIERAAQVPGEPDFPPLMRPVYDESLPATEVQLDPVQARADQATEVNTPVPRDVGDVTTLRDVPVVPSKPGLSHLSPDAQEWVSKLKPGARESIARAIQERRQSPDRAGDLGNLQQVLGFKKPGSKTQDSGSAPSPKAEPLDAVEGKTQSLRTEEAPLFDADRPKASGLDPKDLKPLYDAAVGISQFVGRAAKGGLDLWSKRLYKVVGDLPGGKPAAEKAKTAIDRTRQLQGQFDGDRQRFLGEMRGHSPKAKAARASFAEVDWDGEAGFARINDVLDGEVQPRPHELAAVKAYRQAFLGTGRVAEKLAMSDGTVGFQIRVGDKLIPFKVDPKRLRSPRIGTRDLHWYASHPGHPETQRLAGVIADYNPGLTKEAVMQELDFWTEKGITKRGLAEDARTIEHFPTHYRTKDGTVVQLLENDPQRIIDAVTRRFPARMAYAEVFSQGGVPKELAAIQASGETGVKAAHNLMRALNGMDLDKMAGWTDPAEPGSKAAWASRALEVPWTAWKTLKLSMAPLANIPETGGKGRSITGGNLLTGALGADAARMAKAGFDVSFLNRNKKALVDDLANRGLLTREVMDWYYNKSDVPETLNRYVLNTGGAVNQFVNEFNEKMVARLADGWAGQLKRGEGGAIDRFRLKVLEFRPDQIDAIMTGKASKQTYTDLAGRAVEWAQGSTSQAAERSRAGGSRIWNRITIADRFAQMNINRNFDAWAKAGKALADGNASWKDRLAGVAFAADLTVGQTAAAAMTLALKSIVIGGAAVFVDKAFGSPAGLADYLTDAMHYALLGGPVQAVVEASTSDDESVAESLTGGLLPLSTIQNLKNTFMGTGQYEGLTPLERSAQFLRSGTPVAPAIANIVAIVGIAEDDPELDASISTFWKWRSKYAATGHMEGQEADTTGFRAAMRKAVNAMRDGEDPSAAIGEAMGAKGGKTVRASLQGKRLLKTLKPEQLAELREYVGDRTMTKLEQYDALLDAWAAIAYRPRR